MSFQYIFVDISIVCVCARVWVDVGIGVGDKERERERTRETILVRYEKGDHAEVRVYRKKEQHATSGKITNNIIHYISTNKQVQYTYIPPERNH